MSMQKKKMHTTMKVKIKVSDPNILHTKTMSLEIMKVKEI